MLKVSIEDTNIKEEVIIDPYIPLKIKFGHFYVWEDLSRFVRFGDFKHSMLEIGYSAERGVIQSIALISAEYIHINKEHNFKVENCEEGLLVFSTEKLGDKLSTEINSKVVVSTFENEITISLNADKVVRYVKNNRVNFGLNEFDELCCIVLSDLSDKDMNKLNLSLEYMKS